MIKIFMIKIFMAFDDLVWMKVYDERNILST